MLKLSLYVVVMGVSASTARAEVMGQAQPNQAVPPSAQKSAIDYVSTVREPYPIEGRDPKLGAKAGTDDEIQKWLKHFDLVVVVDKASQRLNAYNKYVKKNADGSLQPALHAKISTGQETRDCHFTKQVVKDERTGQDVTRVTEVKPIYKNTPTGYFVPTAIDDDYYSKSYDAANMKYAVRIFPNEGIFNHVYPPGTHDFLGQAASHGCIRMDDQDAQDLFTMVMMTGPQYNVQKDDEFHAHCPMPKGSTAKCTPSAKRDDQFQSYFNGIQNGNYPYSVTKEQTIVNGKPVITQKVHDLKSSMPRLSAYGANETPEVLLPNRSGYVPTDASGAIPRTGRTHEYVDEKGVTNKVKFYNTLYIIKDSRNGTDKELKTPDPISCPTVEQANANLAAGKPLKGDVSVENAQGIQVQNSVPDLGAAIKNFFNGGGLFNFNQPSAQQQQQQPQQPVRRTSR